MVGYNASRALDLGRPKPETVLTAPLYFIGVGEVTGLVKGVATASQVEKALKAVITRVRAMEAGAETSNVKNIANYRGVV